MQTIVWDDFPKQISAIRRNFNATRDTAVMDGKQRYG